MENISVHQYSEYLDCFPDHMCGPDIFYKYNKTLYLIQVKYVKSISKQEQAKAAGTTNPSKFYRTRKEHTKIIGNENWIFFVKLEMKWMPFFREYYKDHHSMIKMSCFIEAL